MKPHLSHGQVQRICAKWKHAIRQRSRNSYQGNARRVSKWQAEVDKWGARFWRCLCEAEEKQLRAAQQKLRGP